MLADFLQYYMSEDLAKQILKKVPYAIVVSLLIYLALLQEDLNSINQTQLTVVLAGSLVVFVALTIPFLRAVNKPLSNLFREMDFKKLVGKLRSIYEEGDALIDDIARSADRTLIFTGFASGVSFTVLLTVLALQFLAYSKFALTETVIATVVVVVYLVYDIARTPIVEDSETESKFPFGLDLFEKYTVSNSLSRLHMKSKGLLYIMSRLVGPLVRINLPKLSFDATLVYENKELENLIENMSGKIENQDFRLEHEDGESISQFFVVGDEKLITSMVEESPKKVFPYLLDANTNNTGKGWTALRLVHGDPGRVVGHMFIQKFKGVYLKTIIHGERPARNVQRARAFQFIFIGERTYVQHVKRMVEINSAKVPPNITDKEFEP